MLSSTLCLANPLGPPRTRCEAGRGVSALLSCPSTLPTAVRPRDLVAARAAWDDYEWLDDEVSTDWDAKQAMRNQSDVCSRWSRGKASLLSSFYDKEYPEGALFLVECKVSPETEREAADTLYESRWLDVDQSVCIGRSGKEQGTACGVNMEVSGSNVSQRHARIDGIRVTTRGHPAPRGLSGHLFGGGEEATFYLHDLASEYGTFVNNRRIPAGTDYEIKPGDVVSFGGQEEATYRIVQVTHRPVLDLPRIPFEDFKWPWEKAAADRAAHSHRRGQPDSRSN